MSVWEWDRKRWAPACRLVALTLALAAVFSTAACSDGVTPQYVKAIRVLPDSAFLKVGQSLIFSVEVVGPEGQIWPDRASRVEWRVGASSVADLEGVNESPTLTAHSQGSTEVVAELGRGMKVVPVLVVPVRPDSVVIYPATVRIARGAGLRVTAVALDEGGNSVSRRLYEVRWTVDDDIAYPYPNDASPATLYARQRGETTLRVTIEGVEASVPVEVY